MFMRSNSVAPRKSAALVILTLLAILAPNCRAPEPASEKTAEPTQETQSEAFQAHVQRGKRLLDENCGDCYQQTREGLEEAISELAAAARMSSENDIEVLTLLASAYNTYVLTYLKWNTPEYNRYWTERTRILERILQLNPDDVVALIEYSEAIDDKDQAVQLWKRVLDLDPDNVSAHRLLGAFLLQKGETEAGLQHWRECYAAAEGRLKIDYGEDLVRALRENGREQEAATLDQEIAHLKHDWLGSK